MYNNIKNVKFVAKTIIKEYFAKGTRHRTLTKATAFMFLLLAAAKFIDIFSAPFLQGPELFPAIMTFTEILCVLIYLSMAVLIIRKTDYKYLLIPDALLLFIKFIHVIEGFTNLFPLGDNDILTKITAVEEIAENSLFIVFLMIFFSGKILKKIPGRIKTFIPYVCIISLLFAFPTTVVLETVKILIEADFFSFPAKTILFNFIINITNEIFLDLPYFMLVLMVYFKPHKKH